MPTIGQLVINLLGNAQPFKRECDSAKQTLGSLGSAIASTAAVTAGLAAVAKTVSLAASFESTESAFTVLLRDAGAAKRTLAELTAFAAATPFQLPEVEDGAKQLLGYGFAADQLVPILRQLGDVGSTLKIPLNDLIYLYGTSATQAHLFAKDINQFASRGIPIIAELSKVLGVAKNDVMSMVEAGQVNFTHLQAAIAGLTGEGGQFQGTMAAAAATLEGRYSNLQDNVTIAMREIGIEIVKAFDLKSVLESSIVWIQQIRNLISGYGTEVISVVGIVASFAVGMAVARGAMLAYSIAQRIATASSIMFQSITNPAFIFQMAAGLLFAAAACDQMSAAFAGVEADANASAAAAGKVADATAAASRSAQGMKVDNAQLPAELEKQLKILREIEKQAHGQALVPRMQQKQDNAFASIDSMLNIGPNAKKATNGIDELWEAYGKVLIAQQEFGGHEFRLKGIEGEIGRLSGVTDAITKIKDEIKELSVGQNQVQLDKMFEAGATPDQLRELKAQQAALEQAKSDNKSKTDAKDDAKKLMESTRTPLEKFHAELEKIQKLKDSGLIDQKTLDRGALAAAEDFDKNRKSGGKGNTPLSALTEGSQGAQEAIARAMSSGSSNPNKVLESEAKKNGQSMKKAVEYLAQLAAGQKPAGNEVKVVENI